MFDEEDESMEKLFDQVSLERGALMVMHDNSMKGELDRLAVKLHQDQTELCWGETEDWTFVANFKEHIDKIKNM